MTDRPGVAGVLHYTPTPTPLCQSESPLMLPRGGGVTRRSQEINPRSTSSNCEIETLSWTMFGWVRLCLTWSNFVWMSQIMFGRGFRVGIQTHDYFE
jgi:hypothetical protein